MYRCVRCGNPAIPGCILTDDRIPSMSNGDRIVAPRCGVCKERLNADPQWRSTDPAQRVVLISGMCGAGKSTVGKALEARTGFVHIDGDAVSKRVNWDIRNGSPVGRSGYRVFDELLETVCVTLQLGHSVIGTYVFTQEALEAFDAKFAEMGVGCRVFVLKTDKDVCIRRDRERKCWTAGEEFVVKWLEEQRELAAGNRWNVIDNSFEGLNETVERIYSAIG